MTKTVIVAATGGIGRQLLLQAIAAGHDVTAVVRNPQLLPDLHMRVVRADLTHPDQEILQEAVHGADVVLSALGARTAAQAGVASHGTRAIVQAMQSTGVRRLLAVSAASVGTVASPARPAPPRYNPGDGIVTRHLFAPAAKLLFRRHYQDLALMEDVLRDSGLDWTIIRPPRLLNVRLRHHYRTATDINVRGGLFIARADVAAHMLDITDKAETVGHAVGIAY